MIAPMELHVLGSSGTAPRPGRPASGYLVSDGESTVLMDVGPGVAMALMDVMDPGDLDAIVVSHRHPDHCSDLFALFHHYAYEAPPPAPVRIYSPPDVWTAAHAFVAESPAWESVFAWKDATDSETVGAITLSFAAAAHSVPAICVLVSAAGASLSYTGDTGPGGDVAELAAGSNTLLCEATYQDGTHDSYPFHLSATQAGQLATATGAGRLILTHLRSSLDPEMSLAEASAAFSGEVLLAEPGMRIEI